MLTRVEPGTVIGDDQAEGLYAGAPAPAEASSHLLEDPAPAVRSGLLSMRHYQAARTFVLRAALAVVLGWVAAMLFGCGGGDPEDAPADDTTTQADGRMTVQPPPCQQPSALCR